MSTKQLTKEAALHAKAILKAGFENIDNYIITNLAGPPLDTQPTKLGTQLNFF